jgi:hypothetical protein
MTAEESGATSRPTWTIELSHADFRALAKRQGWINDDGQYNFGLIARELCVSESQVRRILKAQQRPGTDFLGGLHVATGDDFRYRKVFRHVPANSPIGKE